MTGLLRTLAERFGRRPALPADRGPAAVCPSCEQGRHVELVQEIITAHFPGVIVGEPLAVVAEVLDAAGDRSVAIVIAHGHGRGKSRPGLRGGLIEAFREGCDV